MPLNRIVDALAHEQVLGEIYRTVYRTEGKVDALVDRVERLEDRDYRHHDKPEAEAWKPRDYMIAASGVGLVIAALLDKVPWSVVQSLISAQK